jgi:hypothetical protein
MMAGLHLKSSWEHHINACSDKPRYAQDRNGRKIKNLYVKSKDIMNALVNFGQRKVAVSIRIKLLEDCVSLRLFCLGLSDGQFGGKLSFAKKKMVTAAKSRLIQQDQQNL